MNPAILTYSTLLYLSDLDLRARLKLEILLCTVNPDHLTDRSEYCSPRAKAPPTHIRPIARLSL